MSYIFYILIFCVAILCLGGLFLCFLLYYPRKPKKTDNQYYYIRGVLPEGGDPFEDRIEFFCVRRNREDSSEAYKQDDKIN